MQSWRRAVLGQLCPGTALDPSPTLRTIIQACSMAGLQVAISAHPVRATMRVSTGGWEQGMWQLYTPVCVSHSHNGLSLLLASV